MNILAGRMGISLGTHLMIERLAEEYGDSYTGFVRGIVESWAEHHRDLARTDTDYDPTYNPAREDFEAWK